MGFKKHEASGVTAQHTKVACFAAGSKLSGSPIERHLDSELKRHVEALLVQPAQPAGVAPLLVPILAAAGRLLFDLYMDKRLTELEELKKAALQTYSATLILDSGEVLKKQVAFLLIRHKEGDDRATFAALLKVRQRGGDKAFTIEPVYVRAVNAVAVTARDVGAIGVSLALSIKGLNKGKDGPVEVVPSGQGAVTVPRLQIGAEAPPFVCPADCPASDLIPYQPNDGPCSVSFAVTETGDVGFDIDVKIAERKALKEALGPAIKDALTESLKEKEA